MTSTKATLADTPYTACAAQQAKHMALKAHGTSQRQRQRQHARLNVLAQHTQRAACWAACRARPAGFRPSTARRQQAPPACPPAGALGLARCAKPLSLCVRPPASPAPAAPPPASRGSPPTRGCSMRCGCLPAPPRPRGHTPGASGGAAGAAGAAGVGWLRLAAGRQADRRIAAEATEQGKLFREERFRCWAPNVCPCP